MDRKAQRASREKTRSHIAHLEKMVQILSDKNGNAATNDLMEEMSKLHAEIDRLRKIIDSIKSVLGADVFENTTAPAPQRQISQSPEDEPNSHSQKSPSPTGPRLCEVNSSSEETLTLQPPAESWQHDSVEDNMGNMNGMAEGPEVGDGLLENSEESASNTNTRDSFDWAAHGVSVDDPSAALTSRWVGTSANSRDNRVFEHTPYWNLPCPLKTVISEPPMPEFEPCKIWLKANAIYAGIFDYPRDMIQMANKVDAGSLFKVVREGWGALSLKERANPVLQILKEVDQNLFWDLDPVTKVANLYKSMLLLKYYFNAEPHNLEQMPNWQRPVQSQKARRHPIPIDFFPWPALRDRLVRHHNYYFADSEFSTQYRQHFKFSWPFGFDDTYRYDPARRTYRISPLFERYHRDMRCWSLEQVFFDRFPELTGEISVYQIDPHDLSSSTTLPTNISPHQPFDMDPGINSQVHPCAENFGSSNCNFADECVLELFNEYPPT